MARIHVHVPLIYCVVDHALLQAICQTLRIYATSVRQRHQLYSHYIEKLQTVYLKLYKPKL